MWQTEWAETPKIRSNIEFESSSELSISDVAKVYLLQWNEHCVECAIPDCYKVCPLYVERRDRKCARFRNGIFPNSRYSGLFPFGAEVEFRRWGKLESTFGLGAFQPQEARFLARLDRVCLSTIRPLSRWARTISPYYRLQGAYSFYRDRLVRKLAHSMPMTFHDFVIEAWNFKPVATSFIVECWQEGPAFRTSIVLPPGHGIHRIPVKSLNVDLYGKKGLIRIYPDCDTEAHVAFSWLDVVQYAAPKQEEAERPSPLTTLSSSKKIKCVVWDLDNTIWSGILGEQEVHRMSLLPGVRDTILALDQRGIIQSIASKNDHDHAWRALQIFGLDHLFVEPMINWNPKSENIRCIAAQLNLGIDACALMDDSGFERTEVAARLPGIRTYSESDVATLLQRPEFDVPITAESRARRSFYIVASERQRQAAESKADYLTFLRGCDMQAKLFSPAHEEHVERCLELLHRSNQLNLSTRRYTRQKFMELLASSDRICICTSCTDRFGDYGIVGVAVLECHPDSLLLTDFVLSCRVAQKKLENGWFNWLIGVAAAAGYHRISARYLKTDRNGVLLAALGEVGFIETNTTSEGSDLELAVDVVPPSAEIVSITANQVTEFPACDSTMKNAMIH